MNMPNKASSATALDSWRGQREHIEHLYRSWLMLSRAIDTMLGAVADASGRLGLAESLTRGQLTAAGEPGPGKSEARIHELRPNVAYPENGKDLRRPYHAVRDVRVIARSRGG
jgi:hypothetical protein